MGGSAQSDGWLFQASFRKELTNQWIVGAIPHLREIPSLLEPVKDGSSGAREESGPIKDAERDNLLRLLSKNAIARSKTGGVVHQMQEISAFERTRMQDDHAVGRSNNPWEWLIFVAMMAAIGGTIIAGVQWWTNKRCSELAARLEKFERRLSLHERVMDDEGSNDTA
jgi:hypothetical protein